MQKSDLSVAFQYCCMCMHNEVGRLCAILEEWHTCNPLRCGICLVIFTKSCSYHHVHLPALAQSMNESSSAWWKSMMTREQENKVWSAVLFMNYPTSNQVQDPIAWCYRFGTTRVANTLYSQGWVARKGFCKTTKRLVRNCERHSSRAAMKHASAGCDIGNQY